MTIIKSQQNAFSAGKISPHGLGRIDLDKYPVSFRDARNMLVEPIGALTRRGGTRYVAEVRNSAQDQVLWKFRFSTDDQYVIEVAVGYFRFYRNQAQIDSGGSPYEVAHTYLESELRDIRMASSGDTIYIVHPDHAPAKLVRTAHTTWTLSTISFTATPAYWGANDYPSRVWIHESRTFWAAPPSYPGRFRASVVDDYEDLTTGSLATDAFDFTLVLDGQSNKIQWALSNEVLAMGTAGAEVVIYPPDDSEAMSAENIKRKRYTRNGSHAVDAVSLDAAALFIQKSKRKMRQFQYVFANDRYEAADLTLLSTGIANTGFEELDYFSDPLSLIWARKTDGELAALTYEPANGIYAWHEHAIAGTDALVTSIAAIDGSVDEAKDELWMVVERTINGSTKRYIEVMDPCFLDEEDIEDAFLVDSGISFSYGSPTTTVSGLSHLEGEEVALFTDGYMQQPQTVVSGEIELDFAATKVHVGLDYVSYVDLVPRLVATQSGPNTEKTKKAVTVYVRVNRTLGLKSGSNSDYMSEYPFGPPDYLDTPIDPVTDILEINIDGESGYDAPVRFESSGPRPLTILSATIPVDVGV